MTKLSEEIKALRESGLTYPEISKRLGCSKSTISYHLSPGQKEKTRDRTRAIRASNSLIAKVDTFKNQGKPKVHSERVNRKVGKFQSDAPVAEHSFTYADVVERFGDSPTCYLTGDPIDLSDPSGYHFDHIHPKSRGGDNSLDNLGLASSVANRAKHNLTVDEFLDLCEKVLMHHGRL